MNKQRFTINLIASMASFILNVSISLLLTPYLVKTVGNEAYGYIGLSLNFIGYASIITSSVNTVIGRFISVEIHKNNLKKANVYFSTIMLVNLLMAIILFGVSIIVIIKLDDIIFIDPKLINDVKITFGLTFFNFIVSVAFAVFNIATFVTNRLDLDSIRKIISYIIKTIFIIFLYWILPPQIYYIALATISSTIFLVIANIFLTKKLIPEIKFRAKDVKTNLFKEIFSSSFWMSVGGFSEILLLGLDLLLANLFLGGDSMGILAIAKTIPNVIQNLLVIISGIFTPQFMISYSKGDMLGLIKESKISIKVQTLILATPLAGFTVYGETFYTLWLPSKGKEEIELITILSILSLLPHLVSVSVRNLSNLSLVLNRVKTPVLVTLMIGFINVFVVIMLLKVTDFGLYAIAGISSVLLIIRSLTFVPMFAGYILEAPKTIFFNAIFSSLKGYGFNVLIFIWVRYYIVITNWIQFILVCVLMGISGYVITFVSIFNKEEKKYLFKQIKNTFKL